MTRVSKLEEQKLVSLMGFYSHAGHSYRSESELDSLKLLAAEIQGLQQAASEASHLYSKNLSVKLTLSVGATPTATSIQALVQDPDKAPAEAQAILAALSKVISRVKEAFTLEIHAGVYPFLDMQQLATRSPSFPQSNPLTTSDIAITVLAEVCSVYPQRDSPEALIAAGSLALGREPCKSYPGWGIVSDWGFPSTTKLQESRSGWHIGRISQEHGILTADPNAFGEGGGAPMELKVGRKIRYALHHSALIFAAFFI